MIPSDSFYINIFPFDLPYVFRETAEAYMRMGVRYFNNVYDCFKPPITFSGKTGIKNLRIWTD